MQFVDEPVELAAKQVKLKWPAVSAVELTWLVLVDLQCSPWMRAAMKSKILVRSNILDFVL